MTSRIKNQYSVSFFTVLPLTISSSNDDLYATDLQQDSQSFYCVVHVWSLPCKAERSLPLHQMYVLKMSGF